MNKKLIFFLLLFLLLSKVLNAQPYGCCPKTCAPINQFCGGYVGANFIFGSINFNRQSSDFTEADIITNNGLFPPTKLSSINRNILNECNSRQALNCVGGGITFGCAWDNCCLYSAIEVNGMFYANPCLSASNDNNFGDDCFSGCEIACNNGNCSGVNFNGCGPCWDDCCDGCEESCNEHITFSGNRNLVSDRGAFEGVGLKVSSFYKNNIRLDGVIKLGFLINPYTATYILGGGSGLYICNTASVKVRDLSDSTRKFTFINDPNQSICSTRWLGGVVIGVGIRSSFARCFDFIIEGRYAKYQNWCLLNEKTNDVDLAKFIPRPITDPCGNSSVSRATINTDYYLVLVGVNWRF